MKRQNNPRNSGTITTKSGRKAHKQLRKIQKHDHRAISRFLGVAA